MTKTNYVIFRNSLKRLIERYGDYQKSFVSNELFESDREAIVESCIQRFETCFDTLWKHLKKYLEEEIGLINIPNGPKPIFRIAGENFIINNYDVWFDYNQKRVDTSHDYSEEKASVVLEIIPSFIEDAIELFEKITGEKWEKTN